MDKKKLQLYFFLALLGAVGVLSFWIIIPYLGVLILAAAISIIVQPIYLRFQSMLVKHDRIAALLTIIVATIIILAPLLFFSYQILQESLNLYTRLSDNSDTYSRTVRAFAATIRNYIPGFDVDLGIYISQILNWVARNLGAIFTGTVQTFFNLFLGFMALYYFLVDGRKFKNTLIALSPLSDDYDQKLIDRLENAVGSVIKGSLLVAAVQGAVSGFGFWIFGVPDPTLWGTCAAVAALIPGIGTSLVVTPAIAYLLLTGHYYAAIGLLIWGATVVGLLDNVIRPVLVGRGVSIHPFFILISVVGGISFFGPLGIIFGPLVLSLLYGLVDIYKLLVLHQKNGRNFDKKP
ncbi:AI-2E family transporter [Candidatus Uhrbacteria bacterium]|nr:AI-2E family transporter [Candidatus Uhrbacteria bacterium]